MKIDIVYGEFDHLADIKQKQPENKKKVLFIKQQVKQSKTPWLVNFASNEQEHKCVDRTNCQQYACAGGV